MLEAIWVLVRARAQIWRNSFWRGRLSGKLGLVAIAALIVTAAFGLYQFTRFLIAGLRSPELLAVLREAATANPGLPADPGPLLAVVPSIVLLAALSLLVFSSFSSLLSALYLAGDLEMLLVAPVPMRAVFVVKFFGGLLPQYLLLFALLGPVLAGYGQGMGYGPLYHLCAGLALLLLPLLPAGIGALLVMAVVRVLPARRVREIVSVLGGLLGVSFYVLSQLGGNLVPRVATPDTLGALLAADLPVLPSTWAGRALVAAGEGRPVALLFYGGLFLVVSLAVFSGCLVLAERLYYAGWSNLATQSGRVRRRTSRHGQADAPPRAARPLPSMLLPPASRAILTKDLRLFFRDLSNLQALIFPLAFAGIWIYQLLSGESAPAGPTGGPALLGELRTFGSVAIAFFICLSLSSALAGSGVSREGRSFWILKIAPISPGELLLGKLTLAYLPFPTVGSLFLVVLAALQRLSLGALLQQWLLLLLCGLGCAAFGMGLGAAFPRLDWENPQQQQTWQSGCISAVFYPFYLLLITALVFGAGALAGVLGGGMAGLGVSLAGWGAAVLLTAGVVWLGARIGTSGLERIEL